MESTHLHLIRARDPMLSAPERREAFGELVLAYQDAAFAIAFAVLNNPDAAEDAAIEAFLDAWRGLNSLREPDAFAGWLRTIVRSRALRSRRKNRLADPLEEGDLTVETRRAGLEPLDLRAALSRLPELERESILLFYVAGLSREETAEAMGVSANSVKKRLAKALTLLREDTQLMSYDELKGRLPSRNGEFRSQTLLLAGQFAELLVSGRPILAALNECAERAGSGPVREVFEEMLRQVEKGEPISDAMLRWPDLIDPGEAKLVFVGEEMGRLDDVLRRLANGEQLGSPEQLKAEYAASC